MSLLGTFECVAVEVTRDAKGVATSVSVKVLHSVTSAHLMSVTNPPSEVKEDDASRKTQNEQARIAHCRFPSHVGLVAVRRGTFMHFLRITSDSPDGCRLICC